MIGGPFFLLEGVVYCLACDSYEPLISLVPLLSVFDLIVFLVSSVKFR